MDPTPEDVDEAWAAYIHGEAGDAGIVDHLSFRVMHLLPARFRQKVFNSRHVRWPPFPSFLAQSPFRSRPHVAWLSEPCSCVQDPDEFCTAQRAMLRSGACGTTTAPSDGNVPGGYSGDVRLNTNRRGKAERTGVRNGDAASFAVELTCRVRTGCVRVSTTRIVAAPPLRPVFRRPTEVLRHQRGDLLHRRPCLQTLQLGQTRVRRPPRH